jgi:hypothetical protein
VKPVRGADLDGEELALRLPGYSARVHATAQDIRDTARWPDLTESERVSRHMVERIDLWGDNAGQADDGDDQDDDGSASRGETPATDEDHEQPVPAAPADTEPARPGPAALPRQPVLLPVFRLGWGRWSVGSGFTPVAGRWFFCASGEAVRADPGPARPAAPGTLLTARRHHRR